MHRTTPRCELPPAKAAWSTYREKTTAVGLTNGAGVFATLASSFRTCQNHSQIRADVAQPVEQRFRKPPVGSSSLPVGSVISEQIRTSSGAAACTSSRDGSIEGNAVTNTSMTAYAQAGIDVTVTAFRAVLTGAIGAWSCQSRLWRCQ